jgi:hypothetical protein
MPAPVHLSHMRRTSFSFIVSLAGCLLSHNATALQVRLLSPAEVIGQQLILGRTHCAGSTWLLTDNLELTRVSVESRVTSTSQLRGLRQGEKPWGLACLSNGELWTLATPEVLARLTVDGHILERVRLDRPRLGIYSAGERLLLQHLPADVGAPLLAARLPRSASPIVLWPAPVSRHALSPEEQLRANFVSCGIGVSGYVPCWLVNEARLAIGDGIPAHTGVRELRFARVGAVDGGPPIWDVALAGSSRVWVLASARTGPAGRRLGERLTRTSRQGVDDGSVELDPAARLIMWATEDRCVLLSATGQLLEVSAP